MITKEYLEELKKTNLAELYRLLEEKDGKDTAFILENLGYLPKGFDVNVLTPFLYHQRGQVRLLAVKNVGKLTPKELAPQLFSVALKDEDFVVRREAISSVVGV
jgi:HEAT repeat protein